MAWRIVSGVIFVLVLSHCFAMGWAQDRAKNDDAMSRLDVFFMNASEVNELCSFDSFFESLTETQEETKYQEIVSQHVCRSQPREMRTDHIRVDKAVGSMPVTSFLELPGIQVSAEPSSFPLSANTRFTRFEAELAKGDKLSSPLAAQLVWEPCLVALCDVGGWPAFENQVAKGYYDTDVLEVAQNPDGTTTIIYLGKNKKWGHEITFSKDPDFLPSLIKARRSDLSPIGPKLASTPEDFRKWRVHSETRNVWTAIGNCYVPESIEMEADYNRRRSYLRFVTTNWKLGKDVATDSLIRESMANEVLLKLDSQAIVDRIEKAVMSIDAKKKKEARR